MMGRSVSLKDDCWAGRRRLLGDWRLRSGGIQAWGLWNSGFVIDGSIILGGLSKFSRGELWYC